MLDRCLDENLHEETDILSEQVSYAVNSELLFYSDTLQRSKVRRCYPQSAAFLQD